MLSRFHGTFILCIATVAGTSYPSIGRCAGYTLNTIGVLLTLPEITHQWSFLGLHLWPKRAVDKPTSNKLEEPPDATQFSPRVLNFFPVPVEEECLSEDKRRQGICMNTYECRIQRGVSHGPCALGFGVCCIFTASCDNEVQNNLTYVTSPGFPNLIDRPMNCSVVVRKIDTEVSQLRIDFVHFNIGQPNAMTGVCDNDVMQINNGRTSFELCGWNSGQHATIIVSGNQEGLIPRAAYALTRYFPSNLNSTRPPCVDSLRGRERRQRTDHFKLPAAERTAVTNVGDARAATGFRATCTGRLSPVLSRAERHAQDIQLSAERQISRRARLPIVRASGARHVRYRLSAVHARLFSGRAQQVAGNIERDRDREHKWRRIRRHACQSERRLRIREQFRRGRRRRRRGLGRGVARAGDSVPVRHESAAVQQAMQGQDTHPLRLRGVHHARK
ncbi:uncharacterized protein LOC116846462 isoform X2 [Odontomachus brunneus]|uniref:uncharacterized protein LOC116846462 isoform X2 n=1 Tax=Odontomachus brunneus TaxID=486640 RepID=UPI0013F24DCD|nr:uncharacterized protein LOC116846462 isoform X2 [Odontomachus brunneus]